MQTRQSGALANELGDLGSPFVSKRLNPADEASFSYAVPDEDTQPSFAQHFKNQRVLSSAIIPNFAGEQWHCDIILLAHPVICYMYRVWDDNGHDAWACQLNGQLSVAVNADPDTWDVSTFYQCLNSFREQCEKYRVLYTGLTGNMVSSDMYNAGVVCAAQYPWEAQNVDLCLRDYVSTPATQGDVMTQYTYPAKMFPDRLKSYTQLCQLTTAYSGDAKYGFYMPLKIYDTRYRNTNDIIRYITATQPTVAYNSTGYNYKILPTFDIFAGKDPSKADTFFPVGAVNGTLLINQPNLELASYYMGQISLRNISAQAQFYMTFRSGYQMVCTPGSMFTQYINPVTPYNPEELVAYSAIASLLKDCYPDYYNDWGKLKAVIKKVWSIVRPALVFAVTHF